MFSLDSENFRLKEEIYKFQTDLIEHKESILN